MLDVVGALVLGAILTADLVVLIGTGFMRSTARWAAFTVAAGWVAIIVAISAAGGFSSGILGPFPAPVLAFLILLVAGLIAWFAWPDFRKALLSVPLEGLIGINAARIAGIFFLLLHAQGRLSAPFATSAGWGDIITGIVAIPLGILVARRDRVPRWILAAWNGFGVLDLVTAVLLGALSAQGTPFRVFTEAPGTAAMGTLPWVGIPALIVPLYLITHLVIGVRLRAMRTNDVRIEERRRDLLPEMADRRIA
jgi:hypothetical protein